MASIVKVGAFAAFVRVVISALGTQMETWRPILWCSSCSPPSWERRSRSSSATPSGSSPTRRSTTPGSSCSASGRARARVAGTLFYVMTYAPTVVATFAVVTLVGGMVTRTTRSTPTRTRDASPGWRVDGGALALTTRCAAHDGFLREVLGAGGRDRRGRKSTRVDRAAECSDRGLLLSALGHGPVLDNPWTPFASPCAARRDVVIGLRRGDDAGLWRLARTDRDPGPTRDVAIQSVSLIGIATCVGVDTSPSSRFRGANVTRILRCCSRRSKSSG